MELFKKLGLIGIAFTISAISLLGYSLMQIGVNQSIISSQSSTLQQIWSAEGALKWWTNFYSTATIPATTILAIAGIGTIFFGLIKEKFYT